MAEVGSYDEAKRVIQSGRSLAVKELEAYDRLLSATVQIESRERVISSREAQRESLDKEIKRLTTKRDAAQKAFDTQHAAHADELKTHQKTLAGVRDDLTRARNELSTIEATAVAARKAATEELAQLKAAHARAVAEHRSALEAERQAHTRELQAIGTAHTQRIEKLEARARRAEESFREFQNAIGALAN